jgi:hypothetical protein
MTTYNFTNFFLRVAFSLRFCLLARLVAVQVVGKQLCISAFPDFCGFASLYQAGFYRIDSVVVHESGQIEIGLTDSENQHIGYFDFDELF